MFVFRAVFPSPAGPYFFSLFIEETGIKEVRSAGLPDKYTEFTE
jgi:hypothetical protein